MTLRLARLWLASGLLAVPGLLAQVPQPGPARPVPPAGSAIPAKANEGMVDSFKVSDVDIDAILSALETYTGRTIVRPV